MINSATLLEAIEDIAIEKGISKEVIIDGISEGFQKAYEKFFDTEAKIVVDLNDKTGELKIYQVFNVADEIDDDWLETDLATAQTLGGTNVQIGDVVRKELILNEEFSRLAVYQVRQILQQKIKNAEFEKIYEKFVGCEKEILRAKITGMNEKKASYLIEIEGVQVSLWNKKIIPGESFSIDEYISVYVEEVLKESRFSQIVVSRTHPNFLSKLIEQQVPEVKEKLVEIKGVSREPGKRAKVAVTSNSPDIDPIGTVIGARGTRINPITKELKNEKIDIILWDENLQKFIMNAMAPVRVISVSIDPDGGCDVIVPNQQLSLAIGKYGISARLVANLVQAHINIFSYEKALENNVQILWNGNISEDELQSKSFLNSLNNRRKGFQNRVPSEKSSSTNSFNSTNDEIDLAALQEVQKEIIESNTDGESEPFVNNALPNPDEIHDLEEIQKNLTEIAEDLENDSVKGSNDLNAGEEEFLDYDKYYD